MPDLDELVGRLVQAANEAIAKAEGDPYGDYEDRARPAAAAVLEALDEYSDEKGPYWEGVNLQDLADHLTH
jgi:hypothetical protein